MSDSLTTEGWLDLCSYAANNWNTLRVYIDQPEESSVDYVADMHDYLEIRQAGQIVEYKLEISPDDFLLDDYPIVLSGVSVCKDGTEVAPVQPLHAVEFQSSDDKPFVIYYQLFLPG